MPRTVNGTGQEPCKRAELVRHVRAVAKLAGGIRVLRAKED